jgi:isoquinoline 1-oxidoreductase beta subunit
MSVSRRAFLATGATAGAALLIGLRLRDHIEAEAAAPAVTRVNPFDAWLRLDQNGQVTLIVAKSEMGQGVFTALPMILADELGVDWEHIRIEQALTQPTLYDHGTGGSTSVRTSWLPLRQAGAAAREMLIAAAAHTWQVDPSSCRVERGFVLDADGSRRASFAELIQAAAKLPVPDLTTVRLKDTRDLRLIGTSPVRRDLAPKIDGTAIFGLDVRVPGMLFAVIARCPTIDGKPRRWNGSKAKQVHGVRDVFEIPPIEKLTSARGIPVPSPSQVYTRGGIAVVADTTWAAIRGRQALEIEWDDGPNSAESSEALRAQFARLLDQPGKAIRHDGDVEAALAGAAVRVEAVYELPLQAHATMEPMNCTVQVRDGSAEAWVPHQFPQSVLQAIALLTGLPMERVTVHTTLMGGSFGRRYTVDVIAEATQIAMRTAAPVQLVWTREDDFQYDFYRQASLHRLRGGLDAEGRAIAWSHRAACTSLLRYWPPPEGAADGAEPSGAADAPYDIPNFRFEGASAASRIPVGWWRSVVHSYTAFVVESFIDEMAAAAHADPLAFRLRLLEQAREWRLPWDNGPIHFERERLIGVLKLAAERAGWNTPPPTGRARGLACAYGFCSYVAQVAEVSIEQGKPRVHRVVCAVDCGQVVHPNNAAAQIEGAIIYGLGATLMSEITIDKGQVQQRNFDTFPLIRMPDAPVVEVHFVPSTAAPSGLGEPGLPPIAPAVANALFALTGARSRRLPIRL